jgi:undecaprenyl-diphosphatase
VRRRSVLTARILPPWLRQPTPVGLGCMLVTVVLGVLVSRQPSGDAPDAVLTRAVTSTFAAHARLAGVLAVPAEAPVIVGVGVLVLLLALFRGRWEIAVLVAAGPVLAVLLVEFVGKPLTGRRHGGGLSYPSGHTTAWVAILCVALLAVGSARSMTRRVLAGVVFVALAGDVMVMLVAGHYHYPSDTLGGAFFAAGVVLLLAAALDRLRDAMARWSCCGRRAGTTEQRASSARRTCGGSTSSPASRRHRGWPSTSSRAPTARSPSKGTPRASPMPPTAGSSCWGANSPT